MSILWIVIANYSGFLVELAVLAGSLLVATRREGRPGALRRVVVTLAAFGTFRLIGEILKLGIGAPRPCWNPAALSAIHCPATFSFPSGHALGSAMAAIIIGLVFRRSSVWLFALGAATLVALSRWVTGVHTGIDVVSGGLLGAVMGGIVWWGYWK